MEFRKTTYYPNMDIVRYVLALAVIIAHTNLLAGYNVWFPVTSGDAVGGFFALSGFLMYPSFCKHRNLLKYTVSRARRILPPYFFIVLLCAIALVTVSSLPWNLYYASAGFWKYLLANLSFLNWLHPELPGVFEGNEFYMSAVNGSLWTMKVEWCLYFSVPVFVWWLSRIKRSFSQGTMAVIVVVMSMSYRWFFWWKYQQTGVEIYEILARQIFGQLAYFYCGILVYIYRDKFLKHLGKFFILGVLCYVIMHFSDAAVEIFVAPVATAIVFLSVSLCKRDIRWLRHSNNISYDMYLFHFPIIQLTVLWGVNKFGVWIEFGVVILITVIMSWMSSVMIDRRFIRR